GDRGAEVGIRPFDYLMSMVVTIALWLNAGPGRRRDRPHRHAREGLTARAGARGRGRVRGQGRGEHPVADGHRRPWIVADRRERLPATRSHEKPGDGEVHPVSITAAR